MIKKIIKYLVIFFIFLVFYFIFKNFYFLKFSFFPELKNPKEITYEWSYQGKKYQIKETLYKSIYDYYKKQPREVLNWKKEKNNWAERYYKMFLKVNKKNKIYSKIVQDIKKEAYKNNINSKDKIAEIIVSFAQSIEYDFQRAENILQNNDLGAKYPYEVLYEKKGACSGKSFLTYLLLKSFGYGVALFEYQDENHLAVGLQCDKKYSTYKSGYCYVETTSKGHLIGVITEYDLKNNRVLINNKIDELAEYTQIKKLSKPAIYQKFKGETYQLVFDNLVNYEKLEDLKKYIRETKKKLELDKENLKVENSKLQKIKNILDKNKNSQNIEAYNKLVFKYNKEINEYKIKERKYNNEVSILNKKISEFNKIQNSFY